MSSVKVGQLYEAKDNYRFEVLCIHEGECFIKWLDEDGTHGVLSEEAIEQNCKAFTENTPQTETQTETQNSNLTFEKRTMRDCYNCERYETEDECIECHYEPKDECAKEYEELGLKELKELIEADRKTEQTEIKGSKRLLKGKDEPQTDCAWK